METRVFGDSPIAPSPIAFTSVADLGHFRLALVDPLRFQQETVIGVRRAKMLVCKRFQTIDLVPKFFDHFFSPSLNVVAIRG
jgi:hypothetical protein